MAEGIPPVPKYEFSVIENAVVGRLAFWLKCGGSFSVVLGVLTFTLAMMGYETPKAINVPMLLAGLGFVSLGSGAATAGRQLGRVVETSGNDVHHLIQAVDSMTKVHRFLAVLLIVLTVLLSIDAAVFLVRVVQKWS